MSPDGLPKRTLLTVGAACLHSWPKLLAVALHGRTEMLHFVNTTLHAGGTINIVADKYLDQTFAWEGISHRYKCFQQMQDGQDSMTDSFE